MNKKAVVLFSGGLDSTTVLAYAKSQGYDVYAISFDYGQRHRSELTAAKNIARQMEVTAHKIFKIDIAQFGHSSLTDLQIDVPSTRDEDIPNTYVPARNTIFLSVALGWAETLGALDIFIGANVIDYSGYPDCRREYMDAFQTLANLATKAGVQGGGFNIQTPIIDLTKAEVITLGCGLGVDYGQTVSCYQAIDGRACGTCDSCHYRREGFAQAKIADPTRYQEKILS